MGESSHDVNANPNETRDEEAADKISEDKQETDKNVYTKKDELRKRKKRPHC